MYQERKRCLANKKRALNKIPPQDLIDRHSWKVNNQGKLDNGRQGRGKDEKLWRKDKEKSTRMTASDPSFSLPTLLLAAPEQPNTHFSASWDAPFSLYKPLSSHSTQHVPRAGTRTLSEPAGEASAPGASLARIRGQHTWDGSTLQTANSKLISSSFPLQGKCRPRNVYLGCLSVCLEAEGWVCLPRF